MLQGLIGSHQPPTFDLLQTLSWRGHQVSHQESLDGRLQATLASVCSRLYALSPDRQPKVSEQRMHRTHHRHHLCCRFRASSKMGDMTYEHPQNVTLSQIIVANEGIVQASQAQQPPDSSEEDAEVRHQQ